MRTHIAWCVAGMVVAVLVGCAGGKSSTTQTEAIDLGTAPRTVIRPPDMEERPSRIHHLRMQRIDLPRGDNLDEAWNLIHPFHDNPIVTRWNDNGLRVGVLSPKDVAAFIASIRNAMRVERLAILAPDGREIALPIAPPLTGNTMIQWSKGHTHQGNITWPMELPRGRPQFLLRVTAGAASPPVDRVTITPHVYHSVPTLVPQTPEEYTRSGRVFEELSLDVNLEPGQMVVLATTSPWSIEEADDTTGERLPTDEETPSERMDSKDLPKPLLRLGDVLLAAKAYRREVQMVVLIGVAP